VSSRPSLRHQAEFLGLAAAARIARRLPFSALRPIANFFGGLVGRSDPRGRSVALANIETAFPGRYSDAEKLRIALGSYRTFARTMLELFWAPNMTRPFVERHVVFEGWGRDYCRQDPSKPAIYACFHFSNFEWLALVGAYTITSGPVIAQRFRNPLLGPVFDGLRKSTGNEVIPQERAMIRMLKHLKSGGKFGMLCDLNLDPREGSVAIDCFGGLLTSVTQTHVALAQRTGAAIVPVECRPTSGGGYRVVHHAPIECPAEARPVDLVQECWNALEPAVHENPECWLWPYKHWRFKPRDGSDRYPFYANHADRFDQLIAG